MTLEKVLRSQSSFPFGGWNVKAFAALEGTVHKQGFSTFMDIRKERFELLTDPGEISIIEIWLWIYRLVKAHKEYKDVHIVSEDHDAAGYGKRMCMIKSTEEAQGFGIEDELGCYTWVTTMDTTRRIGRHCLTRVTTMDATRRIGRCCV